MGVFSILGDNSGEELSKTDMLQTLIQLEEHSISQFNNAEEQANSRSNCTHQTDNSLCLPQADKQSDNIHHLPYSGEISQFPSLQMNKSYPKIQKNQLAYVLLLSLREEQYAIKRSAINSLQGPYSLNYLNLYINLTKKILSFYSENMNKLSIFNT